MRLYTHLQRDVICNICTPQEYTYVVAAEEVTHYEEWVVAGIKFYDLVKGEYSKTLFTIYIYNFTEGFKIIDVSYHIAHDRREFILQFKITERQEKIPNLQENLIDRFLVNVLCQLKNHFHGQNYSKKDKNFFDVIERLQWKAEDRRLAQERKSLGSLNGFICILMVVILGLGLLVAGKIRRKDAK